MCGGVFGRPVCECAGVEGRTATHAAVCSQSGDNTLINIFCKKAEKEEDLYYSNSGGICKEEVSVVLVSWRCLKVRCHGLHAHQRSCLLHSQWEKSPRSWVGAGDAAKRWCTAPTTAYEAESQLSDGAAILCTLSMEEML